VRTSSTICSLVKPCASIRDISRGTFGAAAGEQSGGGRAWYALDNSTSFAASVATALRVPSVRRAILTRAAWAVLARFAGSI
jgi:hypothetical protein